MAQVNGWTFTLCLEMAAAFTFCAVVVMTSPPSGAFVTESALDRRSHRMIKTVIGNDGAPLTGEDIDGNISGHSGSATPCPVSSAARSSTTTSSYRDRLDSIPTG